MTALGPQLAEALGGTWDADDAEVMGRNCDWSVWCSPNGRVWLYRNVIAGRTLLGTFSDGVEALAAKAREMGAT